MNQGNNNFSGGNSGIREISQMSMDEGVSPGKKSPLGDGWKLEQYRKPALLAAAGILALVLLVLLVKAVSGGRYTQKDFEKVATLMFKMPLSEKEMNVWKAQLEKCYPPQAEKVADELFAGMEDFVELVEEMDKDDEETMEMLNATKKLLAGLKVSDSRMLDEEECEECEELIEMKYGVSIKIDEGCLVEVRMKQGLAEELGLDDVLEDDSCGIVLVLRSGKYIGPWASTDGELELDEVNDLRRDLEW